MANIIAVITNDGTKVKAGGAPVFVEHNDEAREQVAFLLEKILDASAHNLKNGSIIIVNRQ
ncbi:hypothetical protein ACFSTH_04435 [Paenibacillus yanchengensis]|uniref:Uncharacterized protein n=1 Tax=Paenibacillus yanchengensis TaxID=2035833 RepID=A0ABW4YKB3_9BACL